MFIFKATLFAMFAMGVVVSVNYTVDASSVISATSHSKMAKLALSGNIIAVPENYNERVFQVAIADEMNELPKTLVVGSSRGMFLGEEITGYDHLYNCCVSGACIEDYYALLGLYEQKFHALPQRVIIEISPWVFYKDNPESRWTESKPYLNAAEELYLQINKKPLERASIKKENPYLSLAYFQHNLSVLFDQGLGALDHLDVHISKDSEEAADFPDGSIRYQGESEHQNPERLSIVKKKQGAVTYESVDQMESLDIERVEEFEQLVKYLLDSNTEIIIYLPPFSATQCNYIYNEGTNPAFIQVEDYIRKFARTNDISIIGSYNSLTLGLPDEYFIDYMHLDKAGTKILWEKSAHH